MPVVVGPSPYHRVESCDYTIGCCLHVVIQKRSDFIEEGLYILVRRAGQYNSALTCSFSEFADVLTEKIKAVFDVRYDRLFLGEFQSTLAHELFHQGLDFVFQHFLRFAGNHEVVGIAY